MKASNPAIIVGAGSIGIPTAVALAEHGIRPLVIDMHPSPGQGENKHAIGGVRATHSEPAKILTCLRSLEILSTWQEHFGDDIEWLKGGYTFPVYRQIDAELLNSLLPIQKQHGLPIEFVDDDAIREIVPGIRPEGLLGGTWSPEDGSVSPLLCINAFYRRALELGVVFRFKEKVQSIRIENDHVTGVDTDHGQYSAPLVVDAAGPFSGDLCRSLGIELPVMPDSHEAAITEPVQPFFHSMVVDIRPGPGSKNFYFYQNHHGQVVCCITPDPPIVGIDKRETSLFLPQVCARLVALIPRLKNLRVRRTWRGLYPATPDGAPIVGWDRQIKGLVHVTGMCGQGLMLGPGLAEVVARLITGRGSDSDRIILEEFSPDRQFAGEEKLK
jgi:sarcosine oxidase subunit beta